MDPRIISLDLESHGSCLVDHQGCPLPPQTTFHPVRMVATDKCPLDRLALTCAITLPKSDPRPSPTSPWQGSFLASLEPGPTFLFNLWEKSHIEMLRSWLLWADTIVGKDLKFDLKILRAFHYLLRTALPPRRHTIIDLSIINYLHNETRPETSLKDIGPLFLLYRYSKTLKEGHRFKSPTSPDFRDYQAQDPHNTLLAVGTLSRHILHDFPRTPKLSPFCLQFYSRTIWSCLLMEESGIPLPRRRIARLHSYLTHRCRVQSDLCAAGGLTLGGKGSDKSKLSFLTSLLQTIHEGGGPNLLTHPLFELTPKKKEVSLKDSNLDLIAAHLPPTSPSQPLLAAWRQFEKHQKLLSTYTHPLLFHKRKKRKKSESPDQSSIIINDLTYPNWYPIPSRPRDGVGASGGTQQARITSKDPASQTFPPIIKSQIRSRYPGGTVLAIDLSQIELRVAALLSGEPALLQAYQNNWDLHARRCLEIWHPSTLLSRYPQCTGHPIDKWKNIAPDFDRRERQVGKRVNFADLFRAGAEKVQMSVYEDIGELFPLSDFRRIVSARARSRPLLYAWQETLIEKAHREGFLCLPLTGQSRYFMGGDKFDVNEIVNFPVQACAGALMLEIQAIISSHLGDPLLPDTPCHLFQNTYDALYLDTNKDFLPRARQLIPLAIEEVSSPTGYWGLLSAHTGFQCPLKFDLKETT